MNNNNYVRNNHNNLMANWDIPMSTKVTDFILGHCPEHPDQT